MLCSFFSVWLWWIHDIFHRCMCILLSICLWIHVFGTIHISRIHIKIIREWFCTKIKDVEHFKNMFEIHFRHLELLDAYIFTNSIYQTLFYFIPVHPKSNEEFPRKSFPVGVFLCFILVDSLKEICMPQKVFCCLIHFSYRPYSNCNLEIEEHVDSFINQKYLIM